MSVSKSFSMFSYQLLSVQSSLSIFAQKYPHICEDTYFILQNKYLCINEDSFGAKIMHNATNSKKFRVVYAAAAVINEVVPNF